MTPRLLICALLLLYLPALASAQQTQLEIPGLGDYEPAPMSPMYDPTEGTIRLDVEVKNKAGYPVTGLRQQDFTLQDNGRPSTIVTFQAFDGLRERPDPPVEVILVIDELNMQVGPQLQAAEDEAETFLRQNQGHLAQPVSIYRISRDGPGTGSYSPTDGNGLAEEIAHQSAPHVNWKKPNVSVHADPFTTRKPINFNVTASLDVLGSIAIEERRRPGRKLLFWLGPGWQIDRPIEGELLQRSIELCIRMREARIAIWEAAEWPWSNGQGNPLPTHDIVDPTYPEDMESGTGDSRSLTLPLMAMQTGGGVLKARNNLFTLIAKRIEEGSCFYSLTFDAPRTVRVDEYHQVKVAVSQLDTTARTRAGYFDEPVFYDQPNPGIVPTTVEQLENALRAARGASDREVAWQLSRMELTERLNSMRLRALESALPGKKARQALVALADESVFLPPPAAEICLPQHRILPRNGGWSRKRTRMLRKPSPGCQTSLRSASRLSMAKPRESQVQRGRRLPAIHRFTPRPRRKLPCASGTAKRSWRKKLRRASHGGQIDSQPTEFSGPFLILCWWVRYEHMATCPGAVGRWALMDQWQCFATGRPERKIYTLPPPTISPSTTAWPVVKGTNRFTGSLPSIRRAERSFV